MVCIMSSIKINGFIFVLAFIGMLTVYPDSELYASNEPENWQRSIIESFLLNDYRNITSYEFGVFAKKNNEGLFVSTTEKIPDWSTLYMAIVNVLSDKYACFMVSKIKYSDSISFRCKDRRTITFINSQKNGNFVYFRSRQFDKFGNRLYVENGRIQLP